jgi:hypothetical protein
MSQNSCHKSIRAQKRFQRNKFQVHFASNAQIGYQGFVPAIKAENMFGETFGKITAKSGNGEVIRGREAPPEERYKTLTMEHHKHPEEMIAPTVAATVGVNRPPEVFEKVNETVHDE